MTLDEIRVAHAAWATRNFPKAEKWEPLVGMVEEVGELSHAFLKSHQGIRVTENHLESMKDAVGDVQMYLWHFCELNGIDWMEAVESVWNVIKHRDWQAYKGNGTTFNPASYTEIGKGEKSQLNGVLGEK